MPGVDIDQRVSDRHTRNPEFTKALEKRVENEAKIHEVEHHIMDLKHRLLALKFESAHPPLVEMEEVGNKIVHLEHKLQTLRQQDLDDLSLELSLGSLGLGRLLRIEDVDRRLSAVLTPRESVTAPAAAHEAHPTLLERWHRLVSVVRKPFRQQRSTVEHAMSMYASCGWKKSSSRSHFV
jgi:hypothetical protein